MRRPALTARTSARKTARIAAALGVAGVLSVMAPLGAMAAPTPPAPPKANDQATFGIGAANAKKLDGRPYLRYLASPGAVAADHVLVNNLGTGPLTLNVYVANTEPGTDGTVGYAARAVGSGGDAAWLTVKTPDGRPMVRLKPRSSIVLPTQLKVPANATPGDHTVAVIASVNSKIKGKSGQLVDFEQRVALRAYIRVSGALNPSLAIENVKVRYTAASLFTGRGSVTVNYSIRNNGNVSLGGRPSVEISGPAGATGTAAHNQNLPTLLPGGSVQVRTDVSHVFAQFWMHAKVSVTPLQPPGDADPHLGPLTAEFRFFAVPWLTVGALGLLVLLLVALLWRRRRGGRQRVEPRHRPKTTAPVSRVEPSKSPEEVLQ